MKKLRVLPFLLFPFLLCVCVCNFTWEVLKKVLLICMLKLFIVLARAFGEIIGFTKKIVEVVLPTNLSTNEIMSFMHMYDSDS